MKITKKWLLRVNACVSGIDWFTSQNETDASKLLNIAINSNSIKFLQFANWAICMKLNKEQCIKYSIFSSEKVIDIFENKYPYDNRPRNSIIAAKKYLKNKNASAANAYAAYAYAAAASAASAAASAASDDDNAAYAAYAAYAAANAAYANAAYTNAYANAAYAAYAAYANAASAASAAYANAASAASDDDKRKKITIEILTYGRKMLEI